MSTVRHPAAADFYSGDCRVQIEQFLRRFYPPESLPEQLIGSLIPHAGWSYSGSVAARTLYTLSLHSQPETCIIFGTDHTGVSRHALYPGGEWVTPLGLVAVNEELVERISRGMGDLVQVSALAHRQEHAIEVALPMIRYFWPEVAIVPITVRPEESALVLGQRVAEIAGRDQIVYIASTDLTHYGWVYNFLPEGRGEKGLNWLQRNDRQLLQLLLSVQSELILEETKRHHNACGVGAVMALTSAFDLFGIKSGTLIEYKTSHGDAPAEQFEMGVGYAGVVW